MGTKERVEILNKSDNVINELLNRVSNLEFEVEKLEKNEQYKYINGQAYFRQDYVLGREKEIERLIISLQAQEELTMNEHIKVERLHSIIKEVREKLEYLLTHDKVEINGRIYIKQEADDFITNHILEILDKENKDVKN